MKRLLLLLFLLHSLLTFSQVRVKGHKFILLPFVSGIWQGSAYAQLEIGHVFDIHYVNKHWGHTILAYSKIGTEYGYKQKVFAPEFSSELDLGFICLRENIEDFLYQGKNKVYLTPDVGLTIAGFITIACGYNEPLSKTGLSFIQPFRFTVNWMLPFAISGSSKYH